MLALKSSANVFSSRLNRSAQSTSLEGEGVPRNAPSCQPRQFRLHVLHRAFTIAPFMGLALWVPCKAPEAYSDLDQAHIQHVEPSKGPRETNVGTSDVAAESSGVTTRPPELAALGGTEWLIQLGADAQVVDFVTPPLGATKPRPLVIAIHGAGDRPDWACGGWRIGMENFAFTLCPMGQPMGRARYAWRSAAEIEAAIDRARLELRRRFPDYLAPAPAIFAGFSQGATLARPILVKRAREFPVAALAEGGYGYLNDTNFGLEYRAAGGRKLLLICGTPGCLIQMSRAQRQLRTAGLDVRVIGTSSAGHNLNREMQCTLRKAWGSFVAAEAGWEAFEAHRWRSPLTAGTPDAATGDDC
ncbi:MAG TPA: hypothetical protein VIV60_07875 [Polyangiaceae bacterium]